MILNQRVRHCDWCDKEFTPVDRLPVYDLLSAGRSICLECSDEWEERQIIRHEDKLKAVYNPQRGAVTTATGHLLPIMLGPWTPRQHWFSRRYSLISQGLDAYGQYWLCRRDYGTLCTLTPLKGHSWDALR